MPKTCFVSSGHDITVLQYNAKYGADGHVERHIRLFDSMKDAQEYLDTIVRDRLVWAGFGSERVLRAEKVEPTGQP